jgi:hypothetical protein
MSADKNTPCIFNSFDGFASKKSAEHGRLRPASQAAISYQIHIILPLHLLTCGRTIASIAELAITLRNNSEVMR